MATQSPLLTNWQPPANFRKVDSTIDGIEVYAPLPDAVPQEEPTAYKCPQCGAGTRYDVTTGAVACEYCGYLAAPEAEQVGRQAQELEFTTETWEKAEQGWGITRQELHCESCGAVLTLPEGSLSASCPFCASNRVTLRVAPDDVLRPRFVIPFKVQMETTRKNVREWLGKGWFHPAELSSSAAVDRFTGIYLPFWTFDAFITADWNAQVGYERHERYYDHASKSWKTKTVIDWRWEDGRVQLQIDDLLLTGSSRTSRVLLERLYPFDLHELTAYSPDFLAGWQAQAYDITLPEAWEAGKTQMRERAKEACYADIPSHHVRNFSMNADFGEEVWRYILLPVYVAAYQFDGKVYQVMVNGQTGSVAGQKPVAWWKIWLAIAALLAPGLLLGLLGLPMMLAAGTGMIFLLVGFFLLVLGGILSVVLYKKALDSEAA